MKNTNKILVVAGILGLAYIFLKRRKKTSNTPLEQNKNVLDATNQKVMPKTREDKINYIIENTEANIVEDKIGFDGTKLVWNAKLGKFYPVGTINVQKMPNYADSVFSSAEGGMNLNPIQKAIESLQNLSDKELDLAVIVSKYRKDNPKAISEEDALIDLGADEKSKALKVLKEKIVPSLNDIKILKKSSNWKEKLQKYRELMQEKKAKRQDRLEKKLSKSRLEKARAKRGNIPTNKERFESSVVISNKNKIGRLDESSEFSGDKSSVSEKKAYNDARQRSFAEQVITRKDGRLFGGIRLDGLDNDDVENMILPKI